MKSKKLGQKLVLNKKTVANLNDDEMKKLRGAEASLPGSYCTSCNTITPDYTGD